MSATDTKVFKTIDQIEAETEKVNHYRQFDYARAVALTQFLREQETKHGDKFRLMTANPKLLRLSGDNLTEEQKDTKTFAIGLWARWAVGEVIYYLQMNENPFFDAYITRHWCLNWKMERSEYGSSMNGIIYDKANWDATPETIAQLVKNLNAALKTTNERRPNTYDKEIPSYERKGLQTIYTT